MQLGIPKETARGETRVAIAPDTVKKFKLKGFQVVVEAGAGASSGFSDRDYTEKGAQVGTRIDALASDFISMLNPPTAQDIAQMKSGAWFAGLLESYRTDFGPLAKAGVNAIAMELVPRTSRAQSMDVLSSQANIAGYRAVLEAAFQYRRFFPMMMTSAGMAKPAKLIVLGVGVAGLQAIATARRLGASVDAFDIRPEVKEQILSLGAKCLEIEVGESGAGAGGYAKELSAEAKIRQQAELTAKLKKYDIIITTANVPGRKAPILVTEEAVQGMRSGSVIIDMAAPSGGNCALTTPGQVEERFGVKIVGHLNYPAMVPADSSQFFGANVFNLLDLLVQKGEAGLAPVANFEDDILAATIVTYQGQVRWPRKP